MRTEGTTRLSPFEFFREAAVVEISTLLGVEVHSGEIIGIDDGLIPYCFYYRDREVEILKHWRPEIARSNTNLSDQTVITRITEKK